MKKRFCARCERPISSEAMPKDFCLRCGQSGKVEANELEIFLGILETRGEPFSIFDEMAKAVENQRKSRA